MPENTVYVGRPTAWGNPFGIEEYKKNGRYGVVAQGRYLNSIIDELSSELFEDRNKAIMLAVDCYKIMIERDEFMLQELEELKGKNLACWCSLSSPCHADILIELLT